MRPVTWQHGFKQTPNQCSRLHEWTDGQNLQAGVEIENAAAEYTGEKTSALIDVVRSPIIAHSQDTQSRTKWIRIGTMHQFQYKKTMAL